MGDELLNSKRTSWWGSGGKCTAGSALMDRNWGEALLKESNSLSQTAVTSSRPSGMTSWIPIHFLQLFWEIKHGNPSNQKMVQKKPLTPYATSNPKGSMRRSIRAFCWRTEVDEQKLANWQHLYTFPLVHSPLNALLSFLSWCWV